MAENIQPVIAELATKVRETVDAGKDDGVIVSRRRATNKVKIAVVAIGLLLIPLSATVGISLSVISKEKDKSYATAITDERTIQLFHKYDVASAF